MRLTDLMKSEEEVGAERHGTPSTEGGTWNSNDPDAVAPKLDVLIQGIMGRFDFDGDGNVSHAEIAHAHRHGRRGTRFEV